MPPRSAVELLRLEMDLLWGDGRGPDLVIACATDGVSVRTGQLVSDVVADAVRVDVQHSAWTTDFSAPPPIVKHVREQLEEGLGLGITLARGSGPTFVIDDDVAVCPNVSVIHSDTADVERLREANPGNWGAAEWTDLLEGHLGTWTMAVLDRRVVSICHTPVSSTSAAEAGTWTHPDFRGRGLAAACTAAWAARMRPTGRVLFYSTSWTNHSSQKVAARLGLRHIGCTWQLQRLSDESGWTDPRVRGALSSIEGSGLVAAALIQAGDIVCVWGGGRTISDNELRAVAASGRRYSSVAIGEDENILWGVEEVGGAGPGGANHSCDPNLWMHDARTVCARRDIASGEELTLDYALMTVSPDWGMACHCGVQLCRGVVTGNDWQLPELQERYSGHFSPFVNARIAAA